VILAMVRRKLVIGTKGVEPPGATAGWSSSVVHSLSYLANRRTLVAACGPWAITDPRSGRLACDVAGSDSCRISYPARTAGQASSGTRRHQMIQRPGKVDSQWSSHMGIPPIQETQATTIHCSRSDPKISPKIPQRPGKFDSKWSSHMGIPPIQETQATTIHCSRSDPKIPLVFHGDLLWGHTRGTGCFTSGAGRGKTKQSSLPRLCSSLDFFGAVFLRTSVGL